MNAIYLLVRHHLIIEYRNWTQVISLGALVWIIAYVIYRLNPEIGPSELNLLYWVFILLLSVNIAMRSQDQMGEEEQLTMYTLVNPTIYVLSRILFNFLYLLTIALLFYLSLVLFFSNVLSISIAYLSLIGLGAMALSACLSLVTSIGAHGGGQLTLVSILSMPLMIPVILVLVRMGDALVLSEVEFSSGYNLVLGISLIGISSSILLFPFVWKH